jgi:16S rRNA processing protein RimM
VPSLHACRSTLEDPLDNGAHPILRVAVTDTADAAGAGQELLIPFVEQFVLTVDKAAGKIMVDWESDY